MVSARHLHERLFETSAPTLQFPVIRQRKASSASCPVLQGKPRIHVYVQVTRSHVTKNSLELRNPGGKPATVVAGSRAKSLASSGELASLATQGSNFDPKADLLSQVVDFRQRNTSRSFLSLPGVYF